MSGGTRCNITHDCDAAGIIAAFGSAGLVSAFAAGRARAAGIGRVVPRRRPGDQGRAGRQDFSTERSGARRAQCACSAGSSAAVRSWRSTKPVTGVERDGESFRVDDRQADARLREADRHDRRQELSRLRHDRRWLRLARRAGPHDPPAAARARAADERRDLAARALRADDSGCAVARRRSDGVTKSTGRRRRRSGLPPGVLIERRGSLLFTHFGLSGPAALDVSRAVTAAQESARRAAGRRFSARRCRPPIWKSGLRAAIAADGRKQVANLLGDDLPRRLVEALLSRAGVPLDRRGAELSKAERGTTCRSIEEVRNPRHRHAAASTRPRSPPAASRSTKSTPATCKASSCRICISPAKFSTSTASSAATTFRPPSAPAGSPARACELLQRAGARPGARGSSCPYRKSRDFTSSAASPSASASSRRTTT